MVVLEVAVSPSPVPKKAPEWSGVVEESKPKAKKLKKAE